MKIPNRLVEHKEGWACGCEIENGHLCGEPCALEGYYYLCDRCWRRF